MPVIVENLMFSENMKASILGGLGVDVLEVVDFDSTRWQEMGSSRRRRLTSERFSNLKPLHLPFSRSLPFGLDMSIRARESRPSVTAQQTSEQGIKD
jgi:hypothetical protein